MQLLAVHNQERRRSNAVSRQVPDLSLFNMDTSSVSRSEVVPTKLSIQLLWQRIQTVELLCVWVLVGLKIVRL
jgi:hypothetical protein